MTMPSAWISLIAAEAALPGEVKVPDALLAAIANGSHSIDVLSNDNDTHQLFECLYLDNGFLRATGACAGPLRQHDRDSWIRLLRWLICELRQWHVADDKNTQKLTAIIIVAQACDIDGQLWDALPDDICANSMLMDAFKRLVSSVVVTFVAPADVRTPLWENEAVDEFTRADAEGDWAKISELWRTFEHLFHPNIVQRQAVRALFRYDRSGLVDASSKVSQTIVAVQIVDVLAVGQRLELAVGSKNAYIQFASAYRTVSRQAGAQSLSAIEVSLLQNLLCLVASDAPRWGRWMQVFNGYPARYPILQTALGRCLASASDAAIEAYVSSIVLHPCPVTSPVLGADEIADCLREFRSIAPLDRRQFLWKLVHDRWLRWGFDQADLSTGLFTVSRCQFDYALVGFSCECIDQAEREERLNEIRQQLERVEDEWCPSASDVITKWNRLLSQMQPYAYAQSIVSNEEDWLPTERICLPFNPSVNRYLAIRYRLK